MFELKDISFGYDPAYALIEGFSMQLESSERIAWVAPSGFGKSSLAQIAALMKKPWSGGVYLEGSRLELTPGYPCPVQLVWQHPEQALDPRLRMSASLEEAGFCLREAYAQYLFEILGLKPEWLSCYPHELSGGELQRFCLMRALLVRPQVLIADEISTMLDALTQAQIWHALDSIARINNMSLIVISHSEALLKRLNMRCIDLTQFQGTVLK